MTHLFKLKKFNILLILICLSVLMNKTDFIKDLNNVLRFDEPSRIVNRYGFCGGESIGYLRYLKENFNFKSNPKIINFIHTPPTNWSIYDTNKKNLKNDFIILINYPGKEIDINLPLHQNQFFKLNKNNYSLGRSSKEIIKFSLVDKTIKNLNIEFFSLDKFKNKKKFYNLNVGKSNNNNLFVIENSGNILNFGKKNIFLKITSEKGVYTNNDIKLIFQNKYQFNKLEILDNYQNCYLIKR
tara:strand:- start:140 stop:862 length:723 start_codon:yes stop_codon:yes gene_type:complete